MLEIAETVLNGITSFLSGMGVFSLTWQMIAMWAVAALLLYLGVAKQFEPLLLVPIAFGALIANIPDNGMLITQINKEVTSVVDGKVHKDASLNDVASIRVKTARMSESEINPPHELSQEEVDKYIKEMTEPMVVSPKLDDKGNPVPGKYVARGQKTEDWMLVEIHGGLFDYIGQGIKAEIIPPLIFMGVGALTDFGPLIAAPRTLLLGAAAQVGVAFTFLLAMGWAGFSKGAAASTAIIGGADGPTSIFLAMKLAPELLGAIAVAAYTYMALVPLIQPPVMMLLTTKKERKIKMTSLREVTKGEKLFFSILVTLVTILLIPDAAPLLGMLMFGNFLRECKVTERLVGAAQNELMNILTIFLGTSVGLTMQGNRFLTWETIQIIILGIIAFIIATASGIIVAKIMNLVWRKNPVNPLIGSAGVSAVPMAARVSHTVGQKADPSNYLLMHAMGPNVAGVIGTAVIAGYYIATCR